MKRFTALYRSIDASTSTQRKVAALVAYFRDAGPRDAAWAAYLLAGGKPRQVVPTRVLRELACDIAGVDPWLFEECYAVTGDLAEAVAYILPPPVAVSEVGLANWMEERILLLRGLDRDSQRAAVAAAWSGLDADERFILVKLIGGGFRVGVSKLLVQRALAEAHALDPKTVAHRMMGYTDAKQIPTAERFEAIIAPGGAASVDPAQPYPFFLAHQLDVSTRPPESLGNPADWLIEWKYDGIRAQLVTRADQVWIWTRGEELVTDRFPEVAEQARRLPQGTVLDGEIVAWLPGAERPAPFALLQRRIGRLALTRKVLETSPVTFIAYDLLEAGGVDIRPLPQSLRRQRLETIANDAALSVSPAVEAAGWPELAALRLQSREHGVEGLMLKQVDGGYGSGRTRADGTWWKWKIDPMTVDAILIYAQAGHGRRANLFTDYTFAVWNRAPASPAEAESVFDAIAKRTPLNPDALHLVPFAKAYSGLTDEEFRQVDRVIRKSIVEKFGPVRSVRPSQVFELGFEGINRSSRHKSGVATRFPRMLRIRDDKPPWEADTLETLQTLIEQVGTA